ADGRVAERPAEHERRRGDGGERLRRRLVRVREPPVEDVRRRGLHDVLADAGRKTVEGSDAAVEVDDPPGRAPVAGTPCGDVAVGHRAERRIVVPIAGEAKRCGAGWLDEAEARERRTPAD